MRSPVFLYIPSYPVYSGAHMNSFILIAVCIGAGYLLRRSGTLPRDVHKGINTWIIYLALPAVSFKYLPGIEWSREMLIPALAPLIVFGGGVLFGAWYGRFRKLDRPTTTGLQLAAGLCNTSFVGFPLIMAYFGEDKLPLAVICDQVTFLIFSVFGITLAVRGSGSHSLSLPMLLRKVASFPPLIGCAAALSLPAFVDITPLNPLFNTLAGTVAPLALFSIGLQLNFEGWRRDIRPMSAILSYKLILAPALIYTVCLLLADNIKDPVPQIAVFESAMPVLLSLSIVADEYRLNPALINRLIGISILVSFISTAGWWLVLR